MRWASRIALLNGSMVSDIVRVRVEVWQVSRYVVEGDAKSIKTALFVRFLKDGLGFSVRYG